MITKTSKHLRSNAMADMGKYPGTSCSFCGIFRNTLERWYGVLIKFMIIFAVMILVSACGGGGGGGGIVGNTVPASTGGGSGGSGSGGAYVTPTYTVGGVVSGLTGTVVFQNRGGDDLTIRATGPFTFSTALETGSTYTVTVKTQPAGQTCSIVHGMGVVLGANVSTVTVTCSKFTYTVSGLVSGLSGTLVLQNNDMDIIALVSNGTFTFNPLADGTTYDVVAKAEPTSQACTVVNSSGTISGGDVTGVAVTCQDALAWDALVSLADGSIMSDVGGYKIYYGTEPGVYTSSIDVGNKTRYLISDFSGAVTKKGITYYITVTAYDATKTMESAYSNEIARLIN